MVDQVEAKHVEFILQKDVVEEGRTATIQQSENIEDIPLKDAVIHETHSSNTNNDNVDDDSNTKRSSNKTIKKRRKQHKTERDILYAIANGSSSWWVLQ